MRSCVRTLLIAALLPVLFVGTVQAQAAPPARNFYTTMRTGIGYSAVLPDAVVGAGFFHLFSRFGVFAEGKLTLPSITGDEEYCPSALGSCDVEWVLANRNDQEADAFDEYLIFNAGIVYAVTPEFALMFGGGAAREDHYKEYLDENFEDPDLRITETGRFFVDDLAPSGWKANAVASALLRAGKNFVFRFGYESAPGSMSVGAYFVLP